MFTYKKEIVKSHSVVNPVSIDDEIKKFKNEGWDVYTKDSEVYENEIENGISGTATYYTLYMRKAC